MNKELFQNNRRKFSSMMKKNSIAIFFSNTFLRDTADQFYPFSVDRNFFYLTGIDRENMILVISKINEEVEECLYIPPIDELYEKWHALFMRTDEAMERSGMDNVLDINSFDSSLSKKVYSSGNIEYLYTFSHVTEMDEVENKYRRFAKKMNNQFPSIRIINSFPIMALLRSRKEKEEVAEIKKAIDFTKEALDFVMKNLKPGIFEHEITAHYQYQLALKK